MYNTTATRIHYYDILVASFGGEGNATTNSSTGGIGLSFRLGPATGKIAARKQQF